MRRLPQPHSRGRAEYRLALEPNPAAYEQVCTSRCHRRPAPAASARRKERRRGHRRLGARAQSGSHRRPARTRSGEARAPGPWRREQLNTSRLLPLTGARQPTSSSAVVAAHRRPFETQLLEPHWRKKAAEVVAFGARHAVRHRALQRQAGESGRVDPKTAREIFIREGFGGRRCRGPWSANCPSSPTTGGRLPGQALEHKSRRQDVLVDDEA